ncbi:MAG: hypothetical protein ACLPN5_21315 [Roseiarcus sp.]
MAPRTTACGSNAGATSHSELVDNVADIASASSHPIATSSTISPLVYPLPVAVLAVLGALVYTLGFGFLIAAADAAALGGIAMLVYITGFDMLVVSRRARTK